MVFWIGIRALGVVRFTDQNTPLDYRGVGTVIWGWPSQFPPTCSTGGRRAIWRRLCRAVVDENEILKRMSAG
jgi:hypothetical protein